VAWARSRCRPWRPSASPRPGQRAARDPFEICREVKAHWPGASLSLLDALFGAVEHRHWRDVARAERASIVLRLEAVGLL